MGGHFGSRIRDKFFRRNSTSPSFLSSNGSNSLKHDGASSTHSQATHTRSLINGDGDVASASNSIAPGEDEGDHDHDHNHEREGEKEKGNRGLHHHSPAPPDSSPNNAKKHTNSSSHLRPILHLRSLTRKASRDGSDRPWPAARSLSFGNELTLGSPRSIGGSPLKSSKSDSNNLSDVEKREPRATTTPNTPLSPTRATTTITTRSVTADDTNSSSTATIIAPNHLNTNSVIHPDRDINVDGADTGTVATTDIGAPAGARPETKPTLIAITTTNNNANNNNADTSLNCRNHRDNQNSALVPASHNHISNASDEQNTASGRDLHNSAAPLGSIREHRPATAPGTAPSNLQLPSSDPNYNYNADVDDDNDDVHTDQDPYPVPEIESPISPTVAVVNPVATRPPSVQRPAAPPRRQSILPTHQTRLITTLLQSNNGGEIGPADPKQLLPISGNMVTRKIWVKRPLASATLITINEDDLVDDVRDLILRKYANSLGRQFDAPDLTIRICPREREPSRVLQPDEPMGRTLDAHYPGGQTVEEALLIDIPSRRTPKASPNPRYYGDDRPHESGTDYFPPYPPAHHTPNSANFNGGHGAHTIHFPPSMAVLGSGQFPALPSPGSVRRMGQSSRPKVQRMHTASPASTATNGGHVAQQGAPQIILQNYGRPPRSRTHSGASSDHSAPNQPPPAAPPLPSPPAPERVATPPPRVSSPRLSNRTKKTKQKPGEQQQQQQPQQQQQQQSSQQQPQQQSKPQTPSLPSGLLNGAVPPINVLIVEDNPINLRLLEAFVKRLKVRWQTAMNGLEAVSKWRAGGFHLVLMDIQLPKMNGLEATREIRRIEKVNNIGVFSSSASSALSPAEKERAPEPEKEEDRLVNTEMFKSPVIIVALTASSLQSDRHEALAAGCNDFLTKPVNFVWLERKVKEWGCMQALIDFDGWRKWKDFSQKSEEDEASKKAASTTKNKPAKKNRLSMTAAA